MNYSDKFTEVEIKAFNEIFDILDSLYKQPNPNVEELDKVYRGFAELLDEYDTEDDPESGVPSTLEMPNVEEKLNEGVNIEPLTLKEFLHEFDFDVYKMKNANGETIYKLVDDQGANLGNIESEEFHSVDDIVDRLDIYYNDYLIEDVEFQLDDLATRVGDDKIVNDWHNLSSYKDIYDYLVDVQEKYCQEDDSPEDFTYRIEYLYYITNPDKLVDDAEFEN